MNDIKIVEEKNNVKINPRDTNRIDIQEVRNYVEVSASGPQGIAGPTGPAGAQGEAGRFFISETAPASPTEGDAWFRSSSAQLYIYYDSYWIETSTSYAGTAGSGVASGGTAGQILTKVNSTDYNTTWTDPSSAVSPTATRWSPTFQATGLTFTGSGNTYPTYNSYYVKLGQLVTFNIKIDLTTVNNFGTGQLKVDLPYAPISTAANHFSAWCWVDPSQPADELNGHIQLVADHLSGSQTLDLHWLLATTANPKPIIESLLVQGTPITFTTASKIYVNGTYISAS